MEGGEIECWQASSDPGEPPLRGEDGADAPADEGGDAQPSDRHLAVPRRATGAGGEIRDEGATGRGSRPKAGFTGFSVSNLLIPGTNEPWEQPVFGKPEHIASPLQIMIDGPLGGAAFNNEFGRPNLGGYFRVYEQTVAGIGAVTTSPS
jgi:phosphoribosylformylglycinamidine synthase